MNNDALILEKIANLNESMTDDFFGLSRKIDDHIKRAESRQESQEKFNNSISEKFNLFRGGVVVAMMCMGTFMALMNHIYSSDRLMSENNDRQHAQEIKNHEERITKLEYKGNFR